MYHTECKLSQATINLVPRFPPRSTNGAAHSKAQIRPASVAAPYAPDQPTPIDALPNHLLGAILAHHYVPSSNHARLHVLSLVCKKWRRLALACVTELAWRMRSWEEMQGRIGALSQLPVLMPSLTELRLTSLLNLSMVFGALHTAHLVVYMYVCECVYACVCVSAIAGIC